MEQAVLKCGNLAPRCRRSEVLNEILRKSDGQVLVVADQRVRLNVQSQGDITRLAPTVLGRFPSPTRHQLSPERIRNLLINLDAVPNRETRRDIRSKLQALGQKIDSRFEIEEPIADPWADGPHPRARTMILRQRSTEIEHAVAGHPPDFRQRLRKSGNPTITNRHAIA